MEQASCPRCGADAGSYCNVWVKGVGNQEQAGLVHPERIAFAAMKLAGRAGKERKQMMRKFLETSPLACPQENTTGYQV